MAFVVEKIAPPKRFGKHEGHYERHIPEILVMLAAAEWAFGAGSEDVSIHPDGMHFKDFDLPNWLRNRAFVQETFTGTSNKTGRFRRGRQVLVVHSRSGLGDVIASIGTRKLEFEAKGGCINSIHAGQLSKLRKGLHEAVGQLMATPRNDAELIAVVPSHKQTRRLAEKLARRCRLVGIEIALVEEDGELVFVQQDQVNTHPSHL